MAKFKLDEHERFVVIGYAVVTGLVVLIMLLVILQFGYFDVAGATGFVPNCLPVEQVCGNKGCRPDGDNQVIKGRFQEQYP